MPVFAVSSLRPSAAGAVRRPRLTWAVALAALLATSVVPAQGTLLGQALAVEASLQGFPGRAESELAALAANADAAPVAERRILLVLLGQAKVLTGKVADAEDLADTLEGATTPRAGDPADRAAALIVRSAIESSFGEASKSLLLAQRARELATGAGDPHLQYWAAMAFGTVARTRGRPEDALASLQDALSLAEAADNAFRRSSALYQMSVLQRDLRNGPEALAASLSAYRFAEAAKSAYAMVNARMAESAVMELLDRPARELAAMQEALAIARSSRSTTAEAKALINLADIRLRRNAYAEAASLSRRASSLAQSLGDSGLAATSKANLGFALLGLGRAAEGKRYADEAMAEYERTGAITEIAELAGEYGRSLEQYGDFKGALAMFHRQRKLHDEIALQARQRILLEVQEKYESDKARREIDFLNRENAIKTAAIANQTLVQRIWWLLAALFALSFVVVAVLYRKLQASNRLLAHTNVELSFLSSRDPLTALYNRRYFQNFIDAEAHSPAGPGREDRDTARALLLIDLDHFKETNDRFGHALGDAVLVAVAERLRGTLRETDMIVRWGGEEFLVLAKTAPDRVDEIAARILRAVAAEPIMLNDKVIRATVSIGYTPLPLPPSRTPLSWDRAIGLVDMALYMAKVNGRNRAYGIQRLKGDGDASLAAAERDLERAWKDGLVDLEVLYGPLPSSVVRLEPRDARPDASARAS